VRIWRARTVIADLVDGSPTGEGASWIFGEVVASLQRTVRQGSVWRYAFGQADSGGRDVVDNPVHEARRLGIRVVNEQSQAFRTFRYS